MSRATKLIGDLRKEGKLAARGQFELDREKAREKMQQFQLADPYHYVLEFISAAHYLDATRIEIRIDADEFELVCDGSALTAEELQNVYSAAFEKKPGARDRALRHLAIGLTAAESLRPKIVEIESGKGDDRVVFHRHSDGEETVEPVAGSAKASGGRTRIYLRETFRTSHILKFFKRITSELPEVDLIADRCVHAAIPIVVNGRRVSRGFFLPDDVLGKIEIETRHETGILGFYRTGDGSTWVTTPPTRVTVCQAGVKVMEHEIDTRLTPVRAVIESDRLTKNLSQSAFVEDTAWRVLMGVTMRNALHRSLLHYVTGMSGPEIAAGHAWLRRVARAIFSEIVRFRKVGARPSEATRKLAEYFEELIIWPLSDRGADDLEVLETEDGERLVSLHALLDANEATPIRTSCQTFPDAHVPDCSPVLYSGETTDLADALGKYTERGFKVVTRRLNVWMERQVNVARWEASPFEEPGPPDFPWRLTVETEKLKGTLALRRTPEMGLSEVALVKEGRLLRRYHPEEFDIRGVRFDIRGELAENEVFDDVLISESEYQEICRELVARFPELVEAYVASNPPAQMARDAFVRKYLEHVMWADLHVKLLDALRIRESAHSDFYARHLDEHAWALSGEVEDAAERRRLIEGLGSIADLPLFDGRKEEMSLRDLTAAYESTGDLYYLTDATTRPWSSLSSDDQGMLAEVAGESMFVVCDELATRLLERLFPGATDAKRQLERMRRRQDFMRRPERQARLEGGGFVFRRPFEGPFWEGELGVWSPTDDRTFSGVNFGGNVVISGITVKGLRYAGPNSITFLHEGRFLGSRKINLPVGNFEAIVACDRLTPSETFDDVVTDGIVQQIVQSAMAEGRDAVLSWCRNQARRLRRMSEGERHFFWSCLRVYGPDYSDGLRGARVIACYDGDLRSVFDLYGHYGGEEFYWVPAGQEIMGELEEEAAEWIVELVEPSHSLAILEELLGASGINVSASVGDPAVLRDPEDAFMMRPVFEYNVPPGAASTVLTTSEHQINATFLGPHEGAGGAASVKWLFRDRLIEETRLSVPTGQFTVVVTSEAITVSEDYDRIVSGKDEVVEHIHDAAESALCRWLADYAEETAEEQREHRATLEQILLRVDDDTWSTAARRAASSPYFPAAGDELLSASEIRLRHRRNVPVVYTMGTDDAARRAGEGALVLRLRDEADLELLNHLLPDVPLRPHSATEFSGFEESTASDGADAAREEAHAFDVFEHVERMLVDVRGEAHHLLGDAHLDMLDSDDEDAFVASEDVLVRYAAETADPVAVAFLASTVYSAINEVDDAITDEHEIEFHDRFAAYLTELL